MRGLWGVARRVVMEVITTAKWRRATKSKSKELVVGKTDADRLVQWCDCGKEYEAFSLSYIFRKGAFFLALPAWKRKRLVGLFWLKQIGLLVLARRGTFIHYKKEWEAWIPTCTVNSSDGHSKDLALYSVLASASVHLYKSRSTLLHYWAADNVVNGLRHE